MKTNKVFICLLIQNNTFLPVKKTEDILYFLRFLKLRYHLEAQLLIFTLPEHTSRIQEQFRQNKDNNIHHVSIIQLQNGQQTFLQYADQMKQRLQKHRHFDYLFLIQSENHFHKPFYENFILCNNKIVFLNTLKAYTPKKNKLIK